MKAIWLFRKLHLKELASSAYNNLCTLNLHPKFYFALMNSQLSILQIGHQFKNKWPQLQDQEMKKIPKINYLNHLFLTLRIWTQKTSFYNSISLKENLCFLCRIKLLSTLYLRKGLITILLMSSICHVNPLRNLHFDLEKRTER